MNSSFWTRQIIEIKEQLLSTGLFVDIEGFKPGDFQLRTNNGLYNLLIYYSFFDVNYVNPKICFYLRHPSGTNPGDGIYYTPRTLNEIFDNLNDEYKEKLSYHLNLFY